MGALLVPVAAAAQAPTWTPLPQPLTVAIPGGDETITITVTGVRAIYDEESEGPSVKRFWVLAGPPGAAMTVTASWTPKDGGECGNGSYYIQELDVGAWPQGLQRTRVVGCTSGPLNVSHSFTNLNRPFTVGLLRLNELGPNPGDFFVAVAFGALGTDRTTLGSAEDHPFAEVDEEELSCSSVGMPGYSVHLGTLGLTVSDTELAYGSLGPRVRTTRTYNALPLEDQPAGAFGAGWRLDYESTITAMADGILLHRGSGAVDPFASTGLVTNGLLPSADVRLTPPASRRERLTWHASSGTFLLEDLGTREVRRYERVSDRTDTFRLAAVLDRNGNAVQVGYENATAAARIARITDAAGRAATFIYGVAGQPVSEMVAPDDRRATFTYADVCSSATGVSVCAPMLSTTTDFLGTVTQFTYDARGYLTRIETAGKTVSIAWRPPSTPAGIQYVASIVDAAGGTTGYAFTGGGATQVTRPSGDVESYLHNGNLLTQSIDAWGRRIVREYQADGLPSRIDDAGAITTLTYDGDRNLLAETDPVGRVTRWTWDADANATSVTSPDGAVWSYAYDARHNLTSVTSPLTHQRKVEYARGLPTAAIDPLGRRRALSYDTQGNLVSLVDRTNRITTFTYDTMGRLASIRPAGDAPGTRFAYDANDRVVSQTAADGSIQRVTYDACTPTTQVDETGARTTTTWDAALRPTAVTDALGQRWSTTYDADGLPLSQADPMGRATAMAYGKTPGSGSVRITDPTRAVSWLYLNPRQALLAVEGPLREGVRPRTRFTRNAADEIVAIEDPRGQSVSYVRDALGRVTKTTPARGGAIDDGFDAEGQWVSRRHDATTSAAFAYDADGMLASSQAFAVGTTRYERDAEGRVLATTHPNGSTSRATFDGRGNRSTLTYASGLVVTYAYDALDRVSHVAWAGASVDVHRDAAGRITRVVRSNGVHTSFTLDALGRVAQTAHITSTNVVASLTVRRDGAGNVTRVHGVEPHPRGFTAETVQVAYDDADQVVTRNGATYRYDADGNLEQVSGAASWIAGYDLENRLVSVSRTGRPSLSFAYDAFGRRARRMVGGSVEEFQRGDDGALLSEADDSGGIAAEYVYLDGRLLAMRRGGATYFYHFDHLGSTLALSDGSGALAATYGYDVGGRVIARSGSLANRFTFVGEHGVEDDGAGLYLMGRRHYDAATGRFVQRDPIGFAGGMNLYAYADGRPTTVIDPEGTNPVAIYYGATALLGLATVAYNWVTSPGDTVHSYQMLQHERSSGRRLDALNRQACNQADRPTGNTPDQMIENRVEALLQHRELWKANVRQIGHTGRAGVDFGVNVVQTVGQTRTVVRSLRNLWGLLPW